MGEPSASQHAEVDAVISVVNHSNREMLVSQCLPALARAADQVDGGVQLVVLDNASSDGSVSAVGEAFPAVQLIPQKRRAGFGANHNTVAGFTDSRYIFVMNDDAVIQVSALATLIEYLDVRPNVAAAAPRIYADSGRIQQTAWRFLTPGRCVQQLLSMGRVALVQTKGESSRRVDRVSGCAVMLRRSSFEEVGGFDEGFFMYSEDSDLCMRLSASDSEVHYVPSASVIHRGQQSSASTPGARVLESCRSQRRYWRKHHGQVGLMVASNAMALHFAVRACLGWLLGLLPAKVRPARASHWPAGEFWLTARLLWREPRGDGLREAAELWNRSHEAG